MKVHTPEHEAATRFALLGGQLLCVLAFLGTHAFPGDAEARPGLLLFALAPPLAFLLHRRLRSQVPETLGLLLLTLPQLLPFLFVPPSDAATILMAALFLLGMNLALASDDDRACAGALFFPPAFIVIEMTLSPGIRWLALFPAALLFALVGANLFDARRRTRWLTERLRLPVPAPGRGDRALILAALGFAVGLLLLLPFLSLPLALLPTPTLGGDVPYAPPGAREELDRAAQASEAPAGGGQTATDAQPFSEALYFSGGVTRLDRAEVMVVRPWVDGQVRPLPGALYLRGMVLDTFLPDRATYRGPVEPPRFEPDAAGWTRFAPPAAPARYELEIRQQPLAVREGGWSILFGETPLLAVDRGPVLFDPDGFFLWPFPADGAWLEYRLRIGVHGDAGSRARRGLPARWTQLPEAPRSMEWIQGLAEEITAGSRSDLERVRRVVAYFREGFEYSLESSDLPGLSGVIDFLERRSGHCSYFAVASTLMLRSLGIPARVATGFLCDQWSEEDDGYLVTTRDGHAWLEVALEGSGWTTFEPTPSGPRAEALAQAFAEQDEGAAAALSRAVASLGAWITTGERWHLDDFAAALGELGAALFATPWLLALLVLAVLAIAWRKLRRGPDHRSPRRAAARVEAGLYARLLQALEKHGFTRSPTETPREFAAEVHARGGELYGPVLEITELFYRARYGRRAWTEEERAEIRRFLGILSTPRTPSS